jgi:hypothetical protein
MVTREEFLDRYTPDALSIFGALFDDSSRWITRVAETVEAKEEAIRRSVSLTLAIPNARDSALVRRALEEAPEYLFFPNDAPDLPDRTLLVPLMFPRRGVLVDNFDVTDENGGHLPVLSQDENKVLAELTIEAAFEEALAITPLDWRDTIKENETLDVLLSLPYVTPEHGLAIANALLERPVDTAIGVLARPNLRRVIRVYGSAFVRTVELRAAEGDRLVLKYAYDSAYREVSRPNYYDRWRRFVGQRPYAFAFPVPLAYRCRSYHFRMHAPDGSYCNRAEFVTRDQDEYVAWSAPEDVQVKSEDAGLPYAHLYAHNLSELDPRPLFARVVFYERPPGSLAATMLFSLLAVATIAVTTAAYPHVVHHADLFAVVLAIPAAAALWLGPLFGESDLVQAPLSARMGALTSGLIGYGAALQVVVAGAFGDAGPISWGLMGFWLLLGLIVFVYVTWRFIRGVVRSAGVRREEHTLPRLAGDIGT